MGKDSSNTAGKHVFFMKSHVKKKAKTVPETNPFDLPPPAGQSKILRFITPGPKSRSSDLWLHLLTGQML